MVKYDETVWVLIRIMALIVSLLIFAITLKALALCVFVALLFDLLSQVFPSFKKKKSKSKGD